MYTGYREESMTARGYDIWHETYLKRLVLALMFSRTVFMSLYSAMYNTYGRIYDYIRLACEKRPKICEGKMAVIYLLMSIFPVALTHSAIEDPSLPLPI